MVVDLVLKSLPENTREEDLKRIANVKHVISASVDNDSIRGVCSGTGRIKIRVGADEDVDTIKLQYLKAGFAVNEHSINPNLNNKFTSE